jgi:hypothetical protein
MWIFVFIDFSFLIFRSTPIVACRWKPFRATAGETKSSGNHSRERADYPPPGNRQVKGGQRLLTRT